MKFTGSPVRFAWILGMLILPVTSAQAQSVTHVFNGAAAHDGAAAARLAPEAHLGSDAKALDHFHSSEASSHLTATHPSTSEFNGFEGHGTTVAHDTPKVEARPKPRVTAPAAKVHASSSEFEGFEGHGATSNPHAEPKSQQLAKTSNPTRDAWKEQRGEIRAQKKVDEYSGHGNARHGSEKTTLQQQETRVRTGEAPDGDHARTSRATRFDSAKAQVEAVERGKTQLAKSNPPTLTAKGKPAKAEEIVKGRKGGFGSGYEEVSQGTIERTGQDHSATVRFRFNKETGQWESITQYPGGGK